MAQSVIAANAPPVARLVDALCVNAERVIQGKAGAIRLAVTCLIAEGHLLIEDVPGVGKTSLAKAIARSISGEWNRIQFTPDLLPSDVTGISIWNRSTNDFEFRTGGIFANVVLADEINRASPKTQSALLEAMEERQVTVDAHTYSLPRPFLVIATQNPVELDGTYPLPQAELDRFLMRIHIGYPDRDAEIAVLDSHRANALVDELSPVATQADILAASAAAAQIHVAPAIKGYIVDIADATRRHPEIALGISPRGALALMRASRALAAGNGRDFVLPDDVRTLAGPVLEHRLVVADEASLRGVMPADVLRSAIASIPAPGAPSAAST